MDMRRSVSRRAAIKDLGKAGLAVVVFGTACTAEPGSTTIPGQATTTSPGETTSTGATGTTRGDTTTTSAPTGSGTQWSRVNMGFVSAYLLYRGSEVAIVDTGQGGAESDIEAALGTIGVGWDAVTSVIVTHGHPDHAGSVAAVAGLAQNSNVYAGEGDIDAIGTIESAEGTQGPVAVRDGDRVFDLEIIETPGHTPGHICVHDAAAGILAVGDAMNTRSGQLQSASADPNFTDDLAQADESVRKLAGFEFEVVLVGHGEPILNDGSAAVSSLADSLNS